VHSWAQCEFNLVKSHHSFLHLRLLNLQMLSETQSARRSLFKLPTYLEDVVITLLHFG
jgi:hypothetical protein